MINTLKDVKAIDGKKVLQERALNSDGSVDWRLTDKLRETHPIFIDHKVDMISFKMLTKPASEGGDLNLCQLTALIATARLMIIYLNKDYPCRENAMTITKLDEAMMWQKHRTANRVARGVEGKYVK